MANIRCVLEGNTLYCCLSKCSAAVVKLTCWSIPQESIFSPNTARLPWIRLLEKRFSLQNSVLLPQPGERQEWKDKQSIKIIYKKVWQFFLVKQGSFAQYNKINPLPLAITTSALVTEGLVGNFSRGQGSKRHGNQMRVPAPAEAHWQCSPHRQ